MGGRGAFRAGRLATVHGLNHCITTVSEQGRRQGSKWNGLLRLLLGQRFYNLTCFIWLKYFYLTVTEILYLLSKVGGTDRVLKTAQLVCVI